MQSPTLRSSSERFVNLEHQQTMKTCEIVESHLQPLTRIA